MLKDKLKQKIKELELLIEEVPDKRLEGNYQAYEKKLKLIVACGNLQCCINLLNEEDLK